MAGASPSCLQSLLRRWCPAALRCLEAVGYDDALAIRDWTHFLLYSSCAISLVFTVSWFADLYTLECSLKHPWMGPEPFPCFRCVYEALGVIVFFATFRDSLRMLLNYDNQHQDLLREREELLDQVRDETTGMLTRANEIVEKMRRMVASNQEKTIRNHLLDLRDNVVPTVMTAWEELHGEEREDLGEAAWSLARLLAQNLQEPGQLAQVLFHSLVETHHRLQSLELGAAEPEQPPSVSQAPAVASDASSEHLARQLFPQMEPLASNGRGRCWCCGGRRRSAPEGDGRSPESPIDLDEHEQVRRVLSPMMESFEAPELLRRLATSASATEQARITRSFGGAGQLRWVGFAWHGAGARSCLCCAPRLIAIPLCCCFCRSGWCCGAWDRYPKRIHVGCFWAEVVSKLHERLLTVCLLCVSYCALYGFILYWELARGCQADLEPGACVYEILRKCTALLTLMCYVPVLCVCLVRIRRIDQAVDVMMTIRRLHDIRRAVSVFERRMRTQEQQGMLLQAVDDRVIVRIDLVNAFRRHITRPEVSASQVKEATLRLERILSDAAQRLGPAAHWMNLPVKRRQELADQVREFEADIAIAPSPPARPSFAARTAPAQLDLQLQAEPAAAAQPLVPV